MTGKKILMLLQSPFPPDIRLEKEIRSLNAAGYEVILLCNQYRKDDNREFPGCRIIRIKALFRNEKLNRLFNIPLFFNPRFFFAVFNIILKEKPLFIHAHDLPMVPLGLLMKFIFGVPVIFDMHENYPEALRVFDKKGIHNFLLKNPQGAARLENYCIKNSDHIIVVVEENKKRLAGRGVPEEKVTVISNTVDLNNFNREVSGADNEEFEERFVILYTGTISPERGLETPLEAIKILKEKIPRILLLLVGAGKSVPSLMEKSRNMGLEENVKFIGWQPHDKLARFLALAKICIIPQPNNDFINTTIPHKMFEYMAMGKPLLVSDALPLKRIISETSAGEWFHSGNSASFAEKAAGMMISEKDYGANGKHWVKEKYNWQIESENLINLYYRLENNL